MKIIIFGATGMVGQGVLRACLDDPEVETILAVGRSSTGIQHVKLREIIKPDMLDLSPLEGRLTGYDACFFCLGVSSLGMTEDAYKKVTYDITLAVAQTLLRVSANITFVFVSGAGTDSSEQGRRMWARVKGKTENALLRLPFKAAYMLRPGYIQPMPGIVSKTRWYRLLYAVLRHLYPVLQSTIPQHVTTTETIGRAMIKLVKQGAPKPVLESPDINSL